MSIATPTLAKQARLIENRLLSVYISKRDIVSSLSREYYDSNYSDFMAKVEEREKAKRNLLAFQKDNQGLLDL